MTPEDPRESPIHAWFSLSYSSYLVLHRSLMQGMPYEWQEKMVVLLEQMSDTYDVDQVPDKFTVQLRNEEGRFIPDPFSDYRHPPLLPYLPPRETPPHDY